MTRAADGERIARLQATVEAHIERYDRERVEAHSQWEKMQNSLSNLEGVLLEGRGMARGLKISGRAALAAAAMIGGVVALFSEHVLPLLARMIR